MGGGHKQQKTVNLESTDTTNNSHCYWFCYQVAADCIWGSLQTWRQKLSPIAPIGPPWGQLEHSLIANTHQMCCDLQYKNIGGHRECWKIHRFSSVRSWKPCETQPFYLWFWYKSGLQWQGEPQLALYFTIKTVDHAKWMNSVRDGNTAPRKC